MRDVTAAEFENFVSSLELIGKPFKYGGRGDSHYDCYGLLMRIYEGLFGVKLPDYLSPSSAAEVSALMRSQLHLWKRTDELRFGTVLFMILGNYTHVAMYIGNDRFIHTCEITNGVCIERLSNWVQKIEGYYEYAGD